MVGCYLNLFVYLMVLHLTDSREGAQMGQEQGFIYMCVCVCGNVSACTCWCVQSDMSVHVCECVSARESAV